MTTSESINEIATALAKAQAEIQNVTKDAKNPHFKSDYATLDAVTDTVRPVFSKHGLAVMQMPTFAVGDDGGNVVTVETLITHSSGQWIRGVSAAPIQKPDPQGVGSATTYLRRYSLAAIAAIAQTDDDGNAASSHGTGAASSSKPSAVPAKPAKYDEWRDALTAAADNGTAALKETWQGTKDRPVMPSFRNYFNATEKEGTLDALKAKAAQAEAVPA
jgi:hypothetical protein